MQNFRNYYDILEVPVEASGEEVKKSFRRLARRYHPDLNPGDKIAEEKFKDINEAYEVLSDEGRRSQYNQLMRYWRSNGKQKTAPRSNNNRSDFDPRDYHNFDEFLDRVLQKPKGNSRQSSRIDPKAPDAFTPGSKKTAYTVNNRPRSTPPREPPRDIEARLSLPLEKAYRGGRERIRLEDGRSIEVEMPMGTVDNQKIRLKGQGLNGGDLYLKIRIEPHPFFELQGLDVFCRIPVTPSEAVLGGPVEVKTLDGLVKMNVPKGVRSGQRLRLANKGFPGGDNERGDQLVEIVIGIPRELTPEEQELYEKLRAIETFKPRQTLTR